MPPHHIDCSAGGQHKWGDVTYGHSHGRGWSKAICIKCSEVLVENRCDVMEASTSGDAALCTGGGKHDLDYYVGNEYGPQSYDGVSRFECAKCNAVITCDITWKFTGVYDGNGNCLHEETP